MTSDRAIVDRFWDELEKSPFLMIGPEHAEGVHSEPMTAQCDTRHGPIWFYTSRGNRLVEGLGQGGHAMAHYASKGHELFACIHGTLAIEQDSAVIDRFWSNDVAAWYPGGRDDPSLLMLRFDTDRAELWLADLSAAGKIKLLFGGDMRGQGQDKHAEVAL